jgi:phage baseplate assembly protein W
MRPDFGCGIHDLVFGAISTQFIGRIRTEVTDALQRYEARIEVLQVAVETGRIDQGRLDVIIDYRVRSTNQTGNFVFPFYIKEAS